MTKASRSVIWVALLFTVGIVSAPSLVIAAPNSHANSNAGGNGNGNANAGGSTVHQYALASGQNQGKISSALKSWNSLNANPKAFLNNLDNPNSLLGKEAKYVCDNATAQADLASFQTIYGDTPPTLDEFNAASAVVADPNASVEDKATAQQVIYAYNAYQDYLTAETAAQDSFLAAGVSYRGATYDDSMVALRETVDGVIAQKAFDSTALCPAASPTVAAQ